VINVYLIPKSLSNLLQQFVGKKSNVNQFLGCKVSAFWQKTSCWKL